MDKRLLKTISKKYFILVSFLLASFLHAQNIDFSNEMPSYEKENYNEALEELKKVDTITISDYDKATWYFFYADIQSNFDRQDIAYRYVLKAENLFESLDSLSDAIDSKFLRLSIVSHQNELEFDEKPIIDDILNYARKKNDSTSIIKAYFRVGHAFTLNDNREKANHYYKTILKKTKKSIDSAHAFMNIGSVYSTISPKNQDSALYYAKKAIPILIKENNKASLAANYNNQAKAYYRKKDYNKAIEYYNKANRISLNKFDKKTRVIYYENLAKVYDKIKDYKNAAFYLNKYIELKDSINDKAQNIAINETNKKFQTEELTADRDRLEKLNIINQSEKKQKDSLLIISLSILALVIISAYFIQKNTRKKQLLAEQKKDLAEQAKDLEAQKVENLLKEQELSSIDAMIAGQEKERQRIAEDLHDDLGGLMATINLHLENVGSENNSKALDKTKTLLGEAYEKIRSISHVKNAGVMASKGLLVAVNDMAVKVTASNRIHIEVIDYGLNERLENSLELSLFRIIQELITNIIKHAEATKATIQLTQHSQNLNIIVEDNGKGFDSKNLKETGIGLQNIKKRVTHLNGKLTIDSTLGKGATILIDIPLS